MGLRSIASMHMFTLATPHGRSSRLGYRLRRAADDRTLRARYSPGHARHEEIRWSGAPGLLSFDCAEKVIFKRMARGWCLPRCYHNTLYQDDLGRHPAIPDCFGLFRLGRPRYPEYV